MTNLAIFPYFNPHYSKNLKNNPTKSISFGITGGKGINGEKQNADAYHRASQLATETYNKLNSQYYAEKLRASRQVEPTEKNYNLAREAENNKFFMSKSAILGLNAEEIKEQEKKLARKTALAEKEKEEAKRAMEEAERLPIELAKLDRSALIKRKKAMMSCEEINTLLDKKLNGFERIAGYETDKEIIKTYLIDPIKNEAKGKTTDVPGSVLFFGPKGNGKTTFALTVRDETDCELIKIRPRGRTLEEKSIDLMIQLKKEGEDSEKRFKEQGKRSILFLDEITRTITSKTNNYNEFMNFLKTCSKKYHCTVFATTNAQRMLNLTKNNCESFPLRVGLEPPDKTDMQKILAHHATLRAKEELNYDEIIDELLYNPEGTYSTSQISMLCRGAHIKTPEGINTRLLLDEIAKTKPTIKREQMSEFWEDVKNIIP